MFVCYVCHKAEPSIPQFRAHLQCHHVVGELQYPILCQDCKSSFTTIYNFIRHVSSFHGNKEENADTIDLSESMDSCNEVEDVSETVVNDLCMVSVSISMYLELILIIVFTLFISPNKLMCILSFRDTTFDADDDEIRILRERRPNAGNRVELLQLMANTREERRLWIKIKSPSITDVLNKYPTFQDIDTAVSTEYTCVLCNYRTVQLVLKQHVMLSL